MHKKIFNGNIDKFLCYNLIQNELKYLNSFCFFIFEDNLKEKTETEKNNEIL